jgi:putative thioredoxin
MHIVLALIGLLAVVFFLLSSKKKTARILTVGSKFEKEVSEKNFVEYVLKTSKQTPVLVGFYAHWCPSCQHLTPLLATMAEEYQGAFLLAKVDTDKNPNLKSEYGVETLPTVALFKNGKLAEGFAGGKLEHSIRYMLAQHEIFEPEPLRSRSNL